MLSGRSFRTSASSTGCSTTTRCRARKSCSWIPGAGSSGYALLADPDGGAHYLLIPTETMTGTDASELLDPNLPNYFAEAWHARALLSTFVGHPVPNTDVGLAVGTAATRKQNQFHIHIACLRPEVVDSLKEAASRLGERWGSLTVAGYPFRAMRLSAQGLEVSNPFELVAASSPMPGTTSAATR